MVILAFPCRYMALHAKYKNSDFTESFNEYWQMHRAEMYALTKSCQKMETVIKKFIKYILVCEVLNGSK